MFTKRMIALMLIVACATTGVLAQAAATDQPAGPDPNQPAAESIYKRIPADCLGFVATKNVNKLLENIQTFAGQVGMGEQLEAMSPGGLLPLMGAMLQLGEGYNPNGGAALVVLDFEKAGIDIETMIDEPDPDMVPPIVVLLAGKSAETAFPALSQKGEDGKVSVMLPMGDMPPMLVAQFGDYIALSPSPKALALMKTDKSIEDVIPAGQKSVLTSCDIVLHENVVAIAPMVKKIMKKMEDNMAGETGTTAPASRMTAIAQIKMFTTGPFAEMLDDMVSLSYGLEFVKEGLMIDTVVDYKPESKLGKLAASYTPTTKPLMNRLPNLPYVLAGGMLQTHNPEYVNMSMQMLEMLLAMGDLEMPADLKERMTAVGNALSEEVTAVQFVGGAPKEKGVFGMGMVIECKDADKTKALLPKKTELLTELIQKTVAVKEEDVKDLTFKYVEGVETVGDMKVDAIVIDSKELREIDDEEKGEMVEVLGEAQVRFLVATVDEKTLAVTLGGSTEFLAETVKAAKSGGGVSKDPGVMQALAKLPKERVFVMVFSPKNMFDTVQAGMKKMDEPSNLPEEFAFEGTMPLAAVSTIKGSTGMAKLFLPATAVKDVINWITAEMSAAFQQAEPGSEPAPVEGESDF